MAGTPALVTAVRQSEMITNEAMSKAAYGDTIAIADSKIRLEGIDAPESDQICLDEHGPAWPTKGEATLTPEHARQFSAGEW